MQVPDKKAFDPFDSFEGFFDQVEKRSDYWVELAKLEFTREIQLKMAADEVSKSELASRLEVRPGMVTRLLSGRNNFELSTMARIATALNCRFRSHLEPLDAKAVWFDVCCLNQQPEVDESPTAGQFREVEFRPVSAILNYEAGPLAA